ncbi:hypothetical protein KY329_03665 [Candidatus Woesearchaeota archaeon]|nr:hypothetical protein [Candidatus Woesearchaeota archaeon]
MTNLKDWILTYLKNRDLYEGNIKSFEDTGADSFVVHRTDGDTFYLVMDILHDAGRIVKESKKLCVITLNKKSNVSFVVDHWDSLKSFRNLCFYFVNPETNDKWVVYPCTHDLITEKAALKKGLMGLFESIPEVKA